METSANTDLFKKISAQLVPDLTKAIKLFKSRLTIILKIIKQPFEDVEQAISEISQQQAQFIAKYQQTDKTILLSFNMQFQRLFCRIIETIQTEKKNSQLQSYISEVQSIIYKTIADQNCDYIHALACIYSKGRIMTKYLTKGQTQSIKPKVKANTLNISKTQKKTFQNKEKNKLNGYSNSLKLLSGLDLDLNYRKDSFLYIPTHQTEAYNQLSERNKQIANDIGFYKKMYTESENRKQKRLSQKKKRMAYIRSRAEAQMLFQSKNQQFIETQGDEKDIQKQFNDTVTGSFKKYIPFSLNKQNKKFSPEQRKTNQSFRQTQTQTQSRQLTPKKILFCFNKLSLKSTQQSKPIQFNIKRKQKLSYQTKIKLKQSMFEIVIQGKKVQDQALDIIQSKKKFSLMSNLNLFA